MSLRLWDQQVVPRLADLSLRSHEVGALRKRTCRGLRGQVLEIGYGSGLNTRFYPPEVTGVSAVEPSDVGWGLAERRRDASDVEVTRAGLDGQAIDLETDSHDSVLITFSLCTIPDPDAALTEARRVLRPGGRLHFLEHGLAPDAAVRRWQARLDPVERALAGGCHLTRDAVAVLRRNQWDVALLQQDYLPGPQLSRPWTYVSLGQAGQTVLSDDPAGG